ncbi:hypothetical protein M405DRAFT_846886 [Rhizopogon salebrosus TDB-379]|nr:hypothetical protein M405DRAFT_846886 [Rhizopogon salebrosus TDB-379]
MEISTLPLTLSLYSALSLSCVGGAGCWVLGAVTAGCWVLGAVTAGCWVLGAVTAGCWVLGAVTAGCWVLGAGVFCSPFLLLFLISLFPPPVSALPLFSFLSPSFLLLFLLAFEFELFETALLEF